MRFENYRDKFKAEQGQVRKQAQRKAVPFSVIACSDKEAARRWRKDFDVQAEANTLAAQGSARQRAVRAFDSGAGHYTEKSTHERLAAVQQARFMPAPEPKLTFLQRAKASISKWVHDLWQSGFGNY